MSVTVFLGGTCNGSLWREDIMPLLQVSFFNPVVADWTPECQAREIEARETSEFCLYVLTPKMTGVYSIAEVVDDSNKRPGKTIFCALPTDETEAFTPAQWKSIAATSQMVEKNGAKVFKTLEEVAHYINTHTNVEVS